MRKYTSESGFSVIELLLIVVALGLIGFAGGYVLHTNKAVDSLNSKTGTQDNTKTAIEPITVPLVAPLVKNTSDLNNAETSLDQNDPSTSNTNDSAELDAEVENLN